MVKYLWNFRFINLNNLFCFNQDDDDIFGLGGDDDEDDDILDGTSVDFQNILNLNKNLRFRR